mmetsp:Transcript_16050/g.40787  ORF Transcript_16050/g.40787 Transcript_16050/m.40787 type:complete len:346 (-) Transcript_16050:1306-2343(-)
MLSGGGLHVLPTCGLILVMEHVVERMLHRSDRQSQLVGNLHSDRVLRRDEEVVRSRTEQRRLPGAPTGAGPGLHDSDGEVRGQLAEQIGTVGSGWSGTDDHHVGGSDALRDRGVNSEQNLVHGLQRSLHPPLVPGECIPAHKHVRPIHLPIIHMPHSIHRVHPLAPGIVPRRVVRVVACHGEVHAIHAVHVSQLDDHLHGGRPLVLAELPPPVLGVGAVALHHDALPSAVGDGSQRRIRRAPPRLHSEVNPPRLGPRQVRLEAWHWHDRLEGLQPPVTPSAELQQCVSRQGDNHGGCVGDDLSSRNSELHVALLHPHRVQLVQHGAAVVVVHDGTALRQHVLDQL